MRPTRGILRHQRRTTIPACDWVFVILSAIQDVVKIHLVHFLVLLCGYPCRTLELRALITCKTKEEKSWHTASESRIETAVSSSLTGDGLVLLHPAIVRFGP